MSRLPRAAFLAGVASARRAWSAGRVGLAVIASCGILVGCNLRDDEPKFNQLDRLRVLGLRTEPADLLPGEGATLRALVFEPAGRRVRYEWSWCPAPIAIAEGAGCAIAENDLRAAWQSSGADRELPRYDLGSDETATFEHLFTKQRVIELCRALTEDAGDNSNIALFGCLQSIRPSVRLRVTAGSSEVIATRDLELLADGTGGVERNQNPEFTGQIRIRSGGALLASTASLRSDRKYDLEVGVDTDQAETFLPPKEEGLDDPVRRRETLVMTWYVTPGATLPSGGSSFPDGDSDHTSFVDGERFGDLLKNGWHFPPPVSAKTAQLFLVLRDERGGVGWQQFQFELRGAR